MGDQERAMNRVLDELSAVRKTFDKDERAFLDALLASARVERWADAAEVESHAFKAEQKADVGRVFAVEYGRAEERYNLKVM